MVKSKIFYVYRQPINKYLNLTKNGKNPHDIFYGLTKVQKYKINYSDKIVSNKFLLFIQNYFNRLVSVFYDGGFSLFTSLFFIPTINKYKLVFATTDTYGLPLALLKTLKIIKPKIILNTIGLYDGLINRNNPIALHLIKKFTKHIDHIVSGGSYQECIKLSYLLDIPLKKFSFIPFGIDTKFFFPKNIESEFDVLVIGADPSRDWKLLIKIANELPNITFHVITLKGLFNIKKPTNITVEYNLDYIQIRERIWKSKIILIPSKNNYHFAGQSTAFRCMSSGKPVIFTKTPGVNEYHFKNKTHCIMVPPNNSNKTIDAIEYLNSSIKIRTKMGKLANKIIKKDYNIDQYSSKLQKIFDNFIS